MMDPQSPVFVAGHRGLIGSAVLRELQSLGYANLLTRTRAQLDLTDTSAVTRFFEEFRPEYVVLAAGRVGGIQQNQATPASFIDENLSIQLNVLRAAHAAGVKRLILFGSSCMYPRECPQPMSETALLTGHPEPSSLAYAISKLAGVQLCLAYNKQYGGTGFIPVIPNSAYGPNDDFNPGTGHVLSSLISRFHAAKVSGAREVILWGTGSPRREFIHADDVADAVIRLLTLPELDVDLPINLGSGEDYSIRDLAEMIARVTGFNGEIAWDAGKPDGAPRKLLDSSRLRSTGWKPRIPFEQGLQNTYDWYVRSVEGAEA